MADSPAPASPGPRRRRSARRDQGPPSDLPATETPPPPTPVAPTPPAAEEQEDRLGRLRKRPRRRTTASPMPVGNAPETPPPAPPRDRRVDSSERALRGLVTTRSTQVNWSAATRAREVAMPTADDLAEAELVIVRRNYTPPEPLRNSRTAEVAARLRRTPRAEK